MKVHHLNCGTMYPLGCGELVRRAVQWARGPKIVEHTPNGEKWRDSPRPRNSTKCRLVWR